MKEKIISHIADILKELGVDNPKVVLEYPAHIEMGDASTNVAMMYAKNVDNTPMYLAELIKVKLEARNIFGVTVAKPGFINFFFDKNYFADAVKNAGRIENIFEGQKTIVEYTDPNPFKEFHIGHLMPNVIGESISRIIEASGAEVKRANYQGDVGLQVAKAVWAIQQGKDLKEAYAFGHKAYEEDEKAKADIVSINKKIYDRSDEVINKIYDEGRKESLDYFEEMYRMLGTKFDFYFFESEVAEFGKETVLKNVGKIFEESEGAVVFRGENFDKKLHTRVFINKEGLPTYEAKELGLSKIKYEKFPYDKSIIITGNEINEYFKVLLSAMKEVFPDLAEKTKHISHGMLRLPEGKMSSRTGNVITAESLIKEVKEKVLESMKESEMSDFEKQDIAELVAISAIKYSILRQSIGGDIIFDFDKSISFEGDSGPYLQYSIVRAKSILKKAEESNIALQLSLPENWKTTLLEKMIERFDGIVFRSAKECSPHHIANYLIELSSAFNAFYAEHKIVDAGDPLSPYRLAITRAFIIVMEKGLDMLGIKVPERM